MNVVIAANRSFQCLQKLEVSTKRGMWYKMCCKEFAIHLVPTCISRLPINELLCSNSMMLLTIPLMNQVISSFPGRGTCHSTEGKDNEVCQSELIQKRSIITAVTVDDIIPSDKSWSSNTLSGNGTVSEKINDMVWYTCPFTHHRSCSLEHLNWI